MQHFSNIASAASAGSDLEQRSRKYVEVGATSRTYTLVHTRIPHILHQKMCVYLFVYLFFSQWQHSHTVLPLGWGAGVQGGGPGSRVSPSIIQRVDTRPEAAGLLAASQETCRSALSVTPSPFFFPPSSLFLANCT